MAPGYTLASVHTVGALDSLYDTLMGLVARMARVGLIHCDFNEYNLMVDDDQKTTLIDFPQMVSTSHANAEMYVASERCHSNPEHDGLRVVLD